MQTPATNLPNTEFNLRLAINQRQNQHFTGRESILDQIHYAVADGSHKEMLNVLVLYGAGGIGKTQLAIEYAYRSVGNFSSVFWIDGTSKQTAERSIRDILESIQAHYEVHKLHIDNPRYGLLKNATTLEQPRAAGISPDPNKSDKDESLTLRKAFHQWLTYEGNNHWLIIMDNVDDLESFDFREFLPATTWGTFLITSRRMDLAMMWTAHEVTEMAEEEALELLQQASHIRLEPDSEGKPLYHRSPNHSPDGTRLAEWPYSCEDSGLLPAGNRTSWCVHCGPATTQSHASLSRPLHQPSSRHAEYATSRCCLELPQRHGIHYLGNLVQRNQQTDAGGDKVAVTL